MYYNLKFYLIFIFIIFFLFTYFFEPKSRIKEETINTNLKLVKEFSQRLNKAHKKIGQLQCEKSQNQVSNSGGWCSKISGPKSSLHFTDKKLARELSNFLMNKEVASFGDGPGIYKQMLNEMKQVKAYDSFDGAPFAEETTDNIVQFLDLSIPVYHLKQYDWIISLEVAEHIPKEYEQVYLDNLVRHAKEGIILSWAREGQEGHSHINNRNFDYVKQEMEKRDFIHNLDYSNNLKNNSEFLNFKLNINVFVKKS